MSIMKVAFGLVAGAALGASATYFTLITEPTEPLSANVLFMGGKNYTVEQLPTAAARALHEIDVQAWVQKQQIAIGAASEIYFQELMKNSGKNRQEVLTEVMGLKEPSDDELQTFFDENKERIPSEFEVVKDQIRSFLMGQDVQEKRAVLVEKLKTEKGMKILLEEPEAPQTVIDYEGFPMKGNPNANVTIVKFADYQCTHCKDAALTMDAMMEKMGDSVRMVYMDFPINNSGISRKVALGAVCADEQGQFWGYNKAAYAQQGVLNAESPMSLATQLALDEKVFAACLESDRPEQRVARAEAEAERLGLTGTPAIFVNGKSIQPMDLEDGLVAAVKKAAGL